MFVTTYTESFGVQLAPTLPPKLAVHFGQSLLDAVLDTGLFQRIIEWIRLSAASQWRLAIWAARFFVEVDQPAITAVGFTIHVRDVMQLTIADDFSGEVVGDPFRAFS